MDSHHQAHLWPRFRFHARDQPALSPSLGSLASEIAPSLSRARISYKDEPRTLMGEMRNATEYSAANCSGEPNLLVIQ